MDKSEIIVNDFPRSPVSEAFRLFRTNLLYLISLINLFTIELITILGLSSIL